MITVRSTINLAHQSVPNIIPVVQGDTGRAILFTLADFTIPEGATARYFVMKPSGLAVYNDATIDGNTVLVELTAQSIIETGDNYGQVRISVGDDIVTSFDFILHVEQFRGIDAVESTTEMNIFDALVTSAVDEAREQIEDIAEEVIETIPDDYTALTENVADLNETIYDLAEAQGNPVIIYDGADNVPVKDLKITFSASSNVNRIQVVRSGKNLVVDKLANGAVDGDGKYTNNSKRITNSLTSTYPISRTWLKAGTYTLSVPGLSACTVVIKTDSTTVAHAWALEQTLPFTFTTQTDGYFIFSARNSANTDIGPSDYHAQLEAGSKATDFEPARVKTVTTILYPLSISEGVLDFTTGQLTSGGSVYAVDAADISTVEGYNRIDAYIMSNSTAHMASTTSIDVIYRKNGYAWDKFLNVYPTESAQGNPASFDDGADNIPVKDLKVTIVPHQDLHGYDHPWPAGGGKNLLPLTVENVKSRNTDGTWNGNAYTYRGITFTLNANEDGSITSIVANGTANNNNANLYLYPATQSQNIPFGGMILSGGVNASVYIQIELVNSPYTSYAKTTGSESIISSAVSQQGTAAVNMFARVVSGETVSNAVFKPMIRPASETDSTFAPYTNICPITGMTEVDVERTGFNVWDEQWENGYINTSTGVDSAANDALRSKGYIKVIPETTYFCNAPNNNTSAKRIRIYAYDSNHAFLECRSLDNWASRNTYGIGRFTAPANCSAIRFTAANLETPVTYNHDICFNIFDPAKNGTYEPYRGKQTVTTDLGRTVYGGQPDITTGELVVDRVGYVFTDGTNLTEGSDGDANWLCVKHTVTSGLFDTAKREQNICSYAPFTFANVNGTCHFYTTGNVFQLFVPKSTYPTLSAFTASLATNPLIYVAFLATPQTYQLTPQELLSVLGTNHISTDAESVEVEYRQDIGLILKRMSDSLLPYLPLTRDGIYDLKAEVTGGEKSLYWWTQAISMMSSARPMQTPIAPQTEDEIIEESEALDEEFDTDVEDMMDDIEENEEE